MNVPLTCQQLFKGNVNMNHIEEVPDFLGGLGDMLSADVLKMVNELLEQLHRKDKDHQGCPVFIYAPGSQYVDKQYIFGDKMPGKINAPDRGGESLPEVLRTEKAMALWKKAQEAGYVDEYYLPLISRTQAALLADAMAERLGIKEKWNVFGKLWHRSNMYKDLYRAMEQKQSLKFQDKLKQLFD